jgi:hypothetical protein
VYAAVDFRCRPCTTRTVRGPELQALWRSLVNT